nr:hypothetical protein [Candidatus Enterousia merdequi]
MFKKHKILFYVLPLLAILVMAVVIIPPMVHLETFKPKIENIITSKTGIPVKVNGDIHISLLGGATIVADDISVPNGVISSCEFAIPFFDIFNLKNANLSNDIIVNKASLVITKIVPFDIDTKIIVKDSKIKFLNKEYKIINGEFSKNNVHALVRTDQHKYEISSSNKLFVVNNNNNNLKLSGELFDDGTAKAHIDIIAKDINKWFEFETPRITGQFPVISDVKWNGSYDVEFNDISAQNISGNIHLQEDGYKIIKLSSKNSDYDLSFLAKNPEIFQESTLDLDFYGKLKFFDKTFRHVVINTIGHDKKVEIKTIITDDLIATDGIIDEFGAHNINIQSKQDGFDTKCLFNGTPTEWYCETFSYGDIIYGKLNVNQENFTADIKSNKKISDLKNIIKHTETFGDTGIIIFDFPNMSGKITIKNKKYNIEYNHLDNKSLQEFGVNLPFIPEFMRFEKGDFVWNKTTMLFTPNSKTWQLSTNNDSFIIIGDDFKKWFPKTNLESLRNSDYTISGNYKKGNISDLKIEISGHTFTGSATNESITLKTDLLNIDELTDKEFKENYEERSFFVRSPITIPFKLNANVALSANKLIYNNKTYNNFVYSLHQDVQTFSITDSDRGNLLATLKKDKIKYDINVQLNKFMVDEKI